MRPTSLMAAVLAISLAMVAPDRVAVAATYTYTTLGVPNALLTYGEAIDNAGQVAGFYRQSYAAAVDPEGFLYSPATGAYTTITPPGAPYAVLAQGVNNLGQVVGAYATASTQLFNPVSSFVFNASTGAYTSFSDSAAIRTNAYGINDAGQIVGDLSGFRVGNGGYTTNTVGFLRDPVTGAYQTFAPPAIPGIGNVNFTGINNAGLIVGNLTTPTGFAMGFSYGGTDYGFVLNSKTGVYTLLSDPLASPAGTTGFMQAPGGTDAYGINDLGQVVGTYYDNNAAGGTQGFLYDLASGTFTTLAGLTPDATITPTGINDSGQIVGSFYSGTSLYSAGGFVATPQAASAVPEPSSFALLGMIAGAAWLGRRPKRVPDPA